MLLRAMVERKTGIKVQHLDQTADFSNHLEEFQQLIDKMDNHLNQQPTTEGDSDENS